MKLKVSLGAGVASDNFDRLVETLKGKDTLHNLAEIAYHIKIGGNNNNETFFPMNANSEEIPHFDLEILSMNES